MGGGGEPLREHRGHELRGLRRRRSRPRPHRHGRHRPAGGPRLPRRSDRDAHRDRSGADLSHPRRGTPFDDDSLHRERRLGRILIRAGGNRARHGRCGRELHRAERARPRRRTPHRRSTREYGRRGSRDFQRRRLRAHHQRVDRPRREHARSRGVWRQQRLRSLTEQRRVRGRRRNADPSGERGSVPPSRSRTDSRPIRSASV